MMRGGGGGGGGGGSSSESLLAFSVFDRDKVLRFLRRGPHGGRGEREEEEEEEEEEDTKKDGGFDRDDADADADDDDDDDGKRRKKKKKKKKEGRRRRRCREREEESGEVLPGDAERGTETRERARRDHHEPPRGRRGGKGDPWEKKCSKKGRARFERVRGDTDLGEEPRAGYFLFTHDANRGGRNVRRRVDDKDNRGTPRRTSSGGDYSALEREKSGREEGLGATLCISVGWV